MVVTDRAMFLLAVAMFMLPVTVAAQGTVRIIQTNSAVSYTHLTLPTKA